MRGGSRATCLLLAVLGMAACGGGGAAADTVLVSAAASLTDVFEEIERGFEVGHPDLDVVINVGGSSSLREQILAGAPVDVFASANSANMDRVVAAGETASSPQIFATNVLQIAVPIGNPAGITGLGDFARTELLIGLCAPGVPCGDLARAALAQAGIEPAVDTNEPDVRALLTKITVGELDAGIVYATDIGSVGAAVEAIDMPPSVSVVAEYPIAVLRGGPNSAAATDFVDYVMSPQGRAILASNGFGAP